MSNDTHNKDTIRTLYDKCVDVLGFSVLLKSIHSITLQTIVALRDFASIQIYIKLDKYVFMSASCYISLKGTYNLDS